MTSIIIGWCLVETYSVMCAAPFGCRPRARVAPEIFARRRRWTHRFFHCLYTTSNPKDGFIHVCLHSIAQFHFHHIHLRRQYFAVPRLKILGYFAHHPPFSVTSEQNTSLCIRPSLRSPGPSMQRISFPLCVIRRSGYGTERGRDRHHRRPTTHFHRRFWRQPDNI